MLILQFKKKKMKKFVLMTLISMMSFIGVNAQTAIETPKLLDNTYLGVFGGASTPLTFNHAFPINAHVGLTLGKNWTPVIGTEIQSGVIFGGNGFDVFGNGYTFVRGINTGINGTVNLTNLFLGFNPKKVFEVQVVGGIGWLHLYSSNALKSASLYTVSSDDDELTAKTAVRFNWNIGKGKAWAVFAEPCVMWNFTGVHGGSVNLDNIQFNKNDAHFSLSLGVNYKFKTSNGTHNFKVWDIGELNDNINNLRSELEKKPKVVVKEKIIERVVEKVVNNGQTKWVVFFAQSSDILTDDAKALLSEITENTTVEVVGHASNEGSVGFNQNLSEKRANAVARFLTSRGVNVTKSYGEGETGTPQNRVVIVTATK